MHHFRRHKAISPMPSRLWHVSYTNATQTHPVYSFTVVTTTLHINAYTVKTSYQFDFERFLSATYC